jgi:hypothetical protein
MNLDYWEEHIKASVAVAAHLLVPVEPEIPQIFLPMITRYKPD